MVRRSKSRSKNSKTRKGMKRRGTRGRMARGKRCWSGGANQLVFPAPVESATYESSLNSSSKMMLGQGSEYQSIHAGQHGGAYAGNPSPAPPGFTGMLDDSLRGQAWQTPLDQSIGAIKGMSDQAGGGKKRKMTKKMRAKMMKMRRLTKKMAAMAKKLRKMRGGAAYSIAGAQDVAAPGMLLSPGQEATALGGMNPEWKLATDPNSFSPNMGK